MGLVLYSIKGSFRVGARGTSSIEVLKRNHRRMENDFSELFAGVSAHGNGLRISHPSFTKKTVSPLAGARDNIPKFKMNYGRQTRALYFHTRCQGAECAVFIGVEVNGDQRYGTLFTIDKTVPVGYSLVSHGEVLYSWLSGVYEAECELELHALGSAAWRLTRKQNGV